MPPEYTARCTDTACTWRTNTPDPAYRDALASQHDARYGHTTQRTDYK